MGVATLVLSLVQPIVARVLVALGVSLVTYVGFDLVMQQVIDRAQNAWGGLPAGILQLAGLAGVGQALSMVFGAILTRLVFTQLSKGASLLSANQ